MTFGVALSLLLVHVSYCSYRDFITVSQILFFSVSPIQVGPRPQGPALKSLAAPRGPEQIDAN